MYDVNSNIDDIVDKVDNIVCGFFKCSLDELYSSSKKGNITCARSFAYFYLHDILCVSTNKVSRIYKRTQGQIKAQNAKTRFLINNDDDYKMFFNGIDNEYKKGVGC